LAERDAHFKNFRAMLQRLAEAEARLALQTSSPETQGHRVVSRVFADLPAEYLSFFATELAKSERTIALLAGAEGGHLLFAQHPSTGKDMNALLKEVLQQSGGKGGGTRDFARGKLADPAQGEKALGLAKERLSSENF